MSKTLAISDVVYEQLAAAAERQGCPNVEALLQRWLESDGPTPRQKAIQRIRKLAAAVAAEHETFPDSTPLIREDRNR